MGARAQLGADQCLSQQGLLPVVGETGQKILRAIVGGERDGQVLAAMKPA
ncbi:MAG: hypothetical protein IPL03_10130 [Sterolibacteriaceae bacterium]|nr:hypothetical protein [Candidatus Methylophosphatis haderslevensis]